MSGGLRAGLGITAGLEVHTPHQDCHLAGQFVHGTKESPMELVKVPSAQTPSPRWRNTQGHFLLKETVRGTACREMHSKDWVCREGAYPKTRKSPNQPAIDLDRGPVRAPDPIDRGLGSVESVPELNNPIEMLKS